MVDKKRISRTLNMGGEQAEADPLLEKAFFDSVAYERIRSHEDRHCFLIGRTGSGKSAILKRIEEEFPERTIRISPDDLSLPYILNLGLIRRLNELDVHLDPFLMLLWRHIFIVELIRHRYKPRSNAERQTMLETLRTLVRRDPTKERALEYISQFGDRFWNETSIQVREMIEQFETTADTTIKGTSIVPHLGAVLSVQKDSKEFSSFEVRREVTEHYQHIVNQTQLADLSKMIEVLNNEVFNSPKEFWYIVIDDLDKDWADESLSNDLIRCLFRAVLDLQRLRYVKIVIALRTNIFEHLNFGSKTGGQEEKFRSLRSVIRWSPTELRALAEQRVAAAIVQSDLEITGGMKALLPEGSKKRGDPMDYLLSYTLLRPRDLIAFVNQCLERAVGKTRLTWSDLDAAIPEYSRNRLLALRDEWKPTFPGIEKVFDKFRSHNRSMNLREFTEILDEIALLVSDRDFEGTRWVLLLADPLWSGSLTDTWFDSYRMIVKLLYDIGFIGIAKDGRTFKYSYEEMNMADSELSFPDTVQFQVHKAFATALDITG